MPRSAQNKNLGTRIISRVFSTHRAWLSCACWLICRTSDKNIRSLDLIFIDLIPRKMHGLVSSSDFKLLYCLTLPGNLFNLIIRLYHLHVFNSLSILVLMHVFGDRNIELVSVGFLNIKASWLVMESTWLLDPLTICTLFYGLLFVLFCFVLSFCTMLSAKTELHSRIKSLLFHIFTLCSSCYVSRPHCNPIKPIVIINH